LTAVDTGLRALFADLERLEDLRVDGLEALTTVDLVGPDCYTDDDADLVADTLEAPPDDPQDDDERGTNQGRTGKPRRLEVPHDRLDGEPPIAWAHYLAYRDAGYDRSLSKVASARRVDVRWLRRLSTRWQWVERVAAYDIWRQQVIDELLMHLQLAQRRFEHSRRVLAQQQAAEAARAADAPARAAKAAVERAKARDRMRRLRAGRSQPTGDVAAPRPQLDDVTGVPRVFLTDAGDAFRSEALRDAWQHDQERRQEGETEA
jgi:hypothetical protein